MTPLRDPGTDAIPLVLRRVPAERRALAADMIDLAGTQTNTADTWWELVDPLAPGGHRPVGLAVTRAAPDDIIRVIAVQTREPGDADAMLHLILDLVAALRRTSAVAVRFELTDQAVLASVLAEGLAPTGRDDTTAGGQPVTLAL